MFALKNWRSWVLVVLSLGPIAVYVLFGTLWLYQRGWLLLAGSLWFASSIAFGMLAARWTRSKTPILPPIDWDAPKTFAKIDRDAWSIVEREGELGDSVSLEVLSDFDIYVNTGRKLARTLAEHYHPLSSDPLQTVPVVDVLTALELAAEDMNHLCRQVPGGDMITPSHWKKAVQVAGYLQRANEIYSYLLPIFSPVNGLMRLGTQQWMVKPAWRDMQQNLLRWFFRAYVNRLGTHLIELYSGRLAIGADRYRRLTRRKIPTAMAADDPPQTIRIGVAGGRGVGKSRLIAAIDQTRKGDLTLIKAKLAAEGVDGETFDRLRSAEIVEVPAYTASQGAETARDRLTRSEAVEKAVAADLLILVTDTRRETGQADAAFAQAWDRWFVEHPGLELPPAFAVVTGIDDPSLGGDWRPPHNWDKGQGPRETSVRARLSTLRTLLPPSITAIIPVSLPASASLLISEELYPTLIAQLHRAERAALIRHFQDYAGQSKVRRLASQVHGHGMSLLSRLRNRDRRPPS